MTPIEQHGRGILFFSAGKDSLATLLALREHWSKLTVVWANPGAPHPAVVEYMDRISHIVPQFVEIKGNQPEWIRENGWPLDVVPIRSTAAGQQTEGINGPRFTSFLACCSANMWMPMEQYVKDNAHTLLIYGQRKAEHLRNRVCDADIQVIDGMTRWQPINNWSDEAVWDYVRTSDIAPCALYDIGATSSVDCWNCTAYSDHSAGFLRYLRDVETDRWDVIQPVLRSAARSIAQDAGHLFELIGD